MIVYGDHATLEAPGRKLAAILEALRRGAMAPPGITRHQHAVAALIEAGELLQGLADAEMRARGRDHASPIQSAAMALLMALARRVGASWATNFDGAVPSLGQEAAALAAMPLPDAVTIRQPEGYAFYALYPEAFFEAARDLPPDAVIIGLRSIGTSLAAMVAAGAGAGLGASAPITLRPVGPPFRRSLTLAPDLLATRLGDGVAPFAIVDEGPGLSGSSFGAVADYLEDRGVAPGRLVFFPGHGGAPGAEASPRHRDRWTRADRRIVAFEDLIGPRLGAWVADLTGPATGPILDLSGGAWRRYIDHEAGAAPPVQTLRERRKFLVPSATGDWLLKFAGLGRIGEAARDRALALQDAGFGPETRGLRHGFLIQRWEGGAKPLRHADAGRPGLLSALGRYLGFRAKAFAAPSGPGADLPALAEMAARNIGEIFGTRGVEGWQMRYGGIRHLPPVRRVETDNRLHLWEWLATRDGRLIKTDGLDHHRAHDLIGCQDIAWDVAGAAVEFGLARQQVEALADAVAAEGQARVDPAMVAWLTPVYIAFQLGLWSMARVSCAQDDGGRIDALLDAYKAKLRHLIEERNL